MIYQKTNFCLLYRHGTKYEIRNINLFARQMIKQEYIKNYNDNIINKRLETTYLIAKLKQCTLYKILHI